MSDTGFALDKPMLRSGARADLIGSTGGSFRGSGASENASGFKATARLRLATAAAAALANSLSGAATALLFLDLLGVKPLLETGPSRKALRKRGVVLRTGIAGSCSSGLGSKSSGNLRLRLKLVCCATGMPSTRCWGICSAWNSKEAGAEF